MDQTTGALGITWYDCRNDTGRGGPFDTDAIPNDDAALYGTYSTDGGATFAPSFRISRGVSNATDANNVLDYGDYTHDTFAHGRFWALWSDNSNSTGDNPDGSLGALDIYAAQVLIR